MTTTAEDVKLPADVQAILDRNPQAKPLGIQSRLPSVRLTAKEGLYFEGVYKTFSTRPVKGKPTKFHAFEFAATSAAVAAWDKETKAEKMITPEKGTLVEVMGGKIIDEAGLTEGSRILIVYLGKVKGQSNSYHSFKVYDLTAK